MQSDHQQSQCPKLPLINLMFAYYRSFIFPTNPGVALIAFLLLTFILMKAEGCRSTQYFEGANCLPCSSAISNCRACSSSTICTVCVETHYHHSGICRICSSANVGCETCVGPNICSKCLAGYYPTGNSSIGYTCDLCNNTMSNCTQCTAATLSPQCTRCQVGFVPGYGAYSRVCHPCSSMRLNCAQCYLGQSIGMMGATCTKCIHPYVLKDQHCYYSCNISMCLVCKDSNLCQTCETNYTALNGQCVLCSLVMTNCQQCLNLTTCTSCIPNTTCFLADIALSNNSSSPSNGNNPNGTNNTNSSLSSTNNTNNIQSSTSSGSSAQGTTTNSDTQSLSSAMMIFAWGLVAGSVVTALFVLIIKKISVPSVGQANTLTNHTLNTAASQAKAIRTENLNENGNNNHSFEELRPVFQRSPSKKGVNHHSTIMQPDQMRKILQLNKDILEDGYE